MELTSHPCERKQNCGEAHLASISVVANVLEHAIIFGLKPKPLYLLVQISDAEVVGVPFCEVGLGGGGVQISSRLPLFSQFRAVEYQVT